MCHISVIEAASLFLKLRFFTASVLLAFIIMLPKGGASSCYIVHLSKILVSTIFKTLTDAVQKLHHLVISPRTATLHLLFQCYCPSIIFTRPSPKVPWSLETSCENKSHQRVQCTSTIILLYLLSELKPSDNFHTLNE